MKQFGYATIHQHEQEIIFLNRNVVADHHWHLMKHFNYQLRVELFQLCSQQIFVVKNNAMPYTAPHCFKLKYKVQLK